MVNGAAATFPRTGRAESISGACSSRSRKHSAKVRQRKLPMSFRNLLAGRSLTVNWAKYGNSWSPHRLKSNSKQWACFVAKRLFP